MGTPYTPVGTGATAADSCGLNEGQPYSVQGGTGVCINMFNLPTSLQIIVYAAGPFTLLHRLKLGYTDKKFEDVS